MRDTYKIIKQWRLTARNIVINGLGGKCQICNYNKCPRALEAHHIDKSKKEVGFQSIIGWDKLYNELRKCILLCAVCHREVHAGITEIPIEYFTFNEEIANSFRSKNSMVAQKSIREETARRKKEKRENNLIQKKISKELRIEKILTSGIDVSKWGWTREMAKIVNIEPSPLVRWMRVHMKDFYEEKCFKKVVDKTKL